MQSSAHSWTNFGSQVGMQQYVAVWVDGKGITIGSKLQEKIKKQASLVK